MADDKYSQFYLAGGTTLALQIGHRKSIDLDLFSDKEFTTAIISNLKDCKAIAISDNSIEIMLHGVKVFFFYFAYPLKNPILEIEGIRLASPIDIGLMKLLALQGRSTKKDIIDLYFIDKDIIPLEELLEIFEKHYPKDSFNTYSSVKKILDPKLYEEQPMPKMYREVEWEQAYKRVERSLLKHVKKLLN